MDDLKKDGCDTVVYLRVKDTETVCGRFLKEVRLIKNYSGFIFDTISKRKAPKYNTANLALQKKVDEAMIGFKL